MPSTFATEVIKRLALPGRCIRTKTFDIWDDAALPAWLTTAAGTTTFGNINATRGYCRCTSAAASGSAARIASTITPHLAQVKAVVWELQSFRVSAAANLDIALGLDAAGLGGRLTQLTADATLKLTRDGPTSNVRAHEWLTMRHNQQRMNLGIALLVDAGEVWAFADDQELHSIDKGSTLGTGGTITPMIEVVARSAAAAWFDFSRVSLTVAVN